jgi:hypothetical protein
MVLEHQKDFQTKVMASITAFRKRYPAFDEAWSSYTGQYGEGSVKVYDPFKISESIDPVTIILGRTTPLLYRDSKRNLAGSLGSVNIQPDEVYVLGRRRSPDSKVIVWSSTEEIEIEHYDSRVRIIPSRIHASIVAGKNDVFFADLGSSSGSILIGESSKPGPFVVQYATKTTGTHRVTIPTKYPPK